jgi:DNA recombination protein RmuC
MDLTTFLIALVLGLLVGAAAGAAIGWSLARERARDQHSDTADDAAAQQQALAHAVQPVQLSLDKVEQRLVDIERARLEAHGELRAQVRSMGQTSDELRNETKTLVNALRAPHVRGRWGEVQLRRVVEVAGMVEHCDFDEQPTLHTADGQLRPDLVVRLAGGKSVAVDAKVSFAGYLEAMEARDDTTRDERMRAHARHLRTHVDTLAAKQYWAHLEPAPEFVVMFVPAEPFLAAALDEDPALLEHAFAHNVVVATPSTLMALLRTVSYTWRQEALAENAQQVHALGKELHNRLATLGKHFARLGGSLDSAVQAYNQTLGSLESRVLVSARRLNDLKVADSDLPSPEPIDLAARVPQAAELVDQAEELVDVDDTRRFAAGG